MVDVESSGENIQVYTRKSRTPYPKDSVPKENFPPISSHKEQHDYVPSSHEAKRKPSESEKAEDHPNMEGEEFHEVELYHAEAEVEKVMQSPLVAYAKSPIGIEEVKSPPREEEAENIPLPEHKEEHAEEKESKTDETPKKHGLSEEAPKGQQEEVGQSEVKLESTILDQLDKEIKRKQVVVEDTSPNWDELLTKIVKDKAKKKARVISKIERDQESNKVVHIATPTPDNNRDEVTTKDYNVQTFNLGPTFIEQDIKDYQGSSTVILGRLRKEVQTKKELKKENEKLRKCLEDLMKPLQSINPSSSAAKPLPKETITEIERMKASTLATANWLQGVRTKGNEAIKDILSIGKDAMREIYWLNEVLAQDKEDIDLLLQKTKTIMEYTKDKLVNDQIIPSSRATKPWESFEALQIRQKFMKKIYKKRWKFDDTLTGVYNGCIAFFDIMTGRRKIAPKYLSLEQLRR